MENVKRYTKGDGSSIDLAVLRAQVVARRAAASTPAVGTTVDDHMAALARRCPVCGRPAGVLCVGQFEHNGRFINL